MKEQVLTNSLLSIVYTKGPRRISILWKCLLRVLSIPVFSLLFTHSKYVNTKIVVCSIETNFLKLSVFVFWRRVCLPAPVISNSKSNTNETNYRSVITHWIVLTNQYLIGLSLQYNLIEIQWFNICAKIEVLVFIFVRRQGKYRYGFFFF